MIINFLVSEEYKKKKIEYILGGVIIIFAGLLFLGLGYFLQIMLIQLTGALITFLGIGFLIFAITTLNKEFFLKQEISKAEKEFIENFQQIASQMYFDIFIKENYILEDVSHYPSKIFKDLQILYLNNKPFAKYSSLFENPIIIKTINLVEDITYHFDKELKEEYIKRLNQILEDYENFLNLKKIKMQTKSETLGSSIQGILPILVFITVSLGNIIFYFVKDAFLSIVGGILGSVLVIAIISAILYFAVSE
jgi:hypothetical protein